MTERKVSGAAAKYFPEAAAIAYLQLEPQMTLIEGRRWRRKKKSFAVRVWPEKWSWSRQSLTIFPRTKVGR